MKYSFAFLWLLLIIHSATIAQEEEFLDSSFGINGMSDLIIDEGENYFTEFLVDDDGKIVVVGHVSINGYGSMLFYRLNQDGTLDVSFGADGYSLVEIIANGVTFNGIADTPDGGYVGLMRTDSNITLIRIDHDGEVVNSFGTAGIATWDLDFSVYVDDVQCKSTGEIIVAGSVIPGDDDPSDFGVFQFTSQGEPDISFGNEGMVIVGVETLHESLQDAYILPDNSILLLGKEKISGGSDLAVLKLHPNGEIDLEFGEDGFWRYTDPDRHHFITDVAVTPSGEIYLIDKFYMTDEEIENHGIMVLKLLPEGVLDNTFDDDGLVQYNYGNQEFYISCGTVSTTNNIVLAGGTSGSLGASYIIKLFDAQGEMTEVFGYDGTVSLFPHPTVGRYIHQVHVLPDGKILCGAIREDDNWENTRCTIMKLAPPVPDAINTAASNELVLLYDATQHEVVINLKDISKGHEGDFQLLDGTGKLILNVSISSFISPVHRKIPPLSDGIYFAVIHAGNKMFVRSFGIWE